MPCNIAEAIEDEGFLVFVVAGIRVSDDGMPQMRLAGEVSVIRKLPDEAWEIIRETLFGAIDDLRSSPLDDLEVRSYE